jgi:hypothetical protein
MASTSIEARPLDAIEELELVKGYVAVAGKPSMRAAMYKPAVAVEFALDSRPEESNDKVIARGGANVYVFHDNDLSICPASAGHFFVFQNCCYRQSRRRLVLPFERLPQSELDLGAQRAQLLPRLSSQCLAQVVLEADREATILVRVVSHREFLLADATSAPILHC